MNPVNQYFQAPPVQDVSNWVVQKYVNTRGSRDKCSLFDSYGVKYFFKESLKKQNYEHEFWSEIIAYHLGMMLKLPVLEYQPAILNNQIGCLCRSFLHADEHLIEGINIIQAYDHSFDPSTKPGRDRYSFQLIERSLLKLGLTLEIERLIQTIIFDSIIGNQDRHQENWGFKVRTIRKDSLAAQAFFAKMVNVISRGYPQTSSGYSEYIANRDLTFNISCQSLLIYDNGSSLGRELSANDINKMLSDALRMETYINRGKAEIRWNDVQLGHFKLVEKLYHEGGYDIWIDQYIKQVQKNYDENSFRNILDILDQGLSATFAHHKLPNERKEFIARLVTRRIKILSKLI